MMRFLLLLLALAAAFGQPADPMQSSIEKQKAAAAQQRESVRKQAEGLRLWLPPARDEPAAIQPVASVSECEALPEQQVSPIIEAAAKGQQLQPNLLRAVIRQESGFHPCAVSPKGAKGLMQLMPDTAQDLGVIDAFDPEQNVQAGAKYLKKLFDTFKGDLPKTLAAYNAGASAVNDAGGVPNFQETRDYVNAIMKAMGITRTAPPSIPTPKPIEN